MSIIIWIIVLAVCLVFLIKSSEYLIDAATKISALLGVSPFIIGMTAVAAGTSLPELTTGILAVVRGDIAYTSAMVIGSNIANIFLVFGIIAIVAKNITPPEGIKKAEIPQLWAATALLIFVAYDGVIQAYEGFMLSAAYIIYLWYFIQGSSAKTPITSKPQHDLGLYLKFILSAAVLYIAATYTLISVESITSLLSLPDTSFLAISAVAMATTLPELSVTLTAFRQNKSDLGFGNIIGSIILNGSLIVGIPAMIGTVVVSAFSATIGLGFLAAAVILVSLTLMNRNLNKYDGAFFVLLYIFFITMLVNTIV